MSVESAEMTKHALNAFLATSVSFINELAALCEQVGADAKEVERGLKSEARIGPRAYLSPGRGVRRRHARARLVFLSELGQVHGVATHSDLVGQGEQRRAPALGGRASVSNCSATCAGRTVGRLGPDLQARHRHAAAVERR